MEMLISQSVSKFSKSWDLSGFLICGPTDTEGGGHLSASRSLSLKHRLVLDYCPVKAPF